MTIRLISGIPGSGKTLYAVSELVKVIEKNSTSEDPFKIYCDITGLKITYIEPPPIDWRKTPPKSLLIYDEAQLRPEFVQKRGRTGYKFIDELTIHRKTGHQIWFITQDPKRLHADILEMVEVHHHLERPYGAKLATIYEYRGAERNPRSQSAKQRAENKKIFNYDKTLYDYYESSQVDDGIKFRLPRELFFWLFVAFAIPVFIFYAFFAQKNEYLGAEKKSETEKISSETPKNGVTSTQNIQEDIKTQNNENTEQINKKRIFYKNWLPKDYEVINSDVNLQVRSVIGNARNCKAYNTHGDLMTLTESECRYYLAESGRVHKSNNQTILSSSVNTIIDKELNNNEQLQSTDNAKTN